MKKIFLVLVFVALCLPLIGYSQNFGKNKVQYDDFNWSYIQTPNFDIYFYDDREKLAEFAAPIAEQVFTEIHSILNWRMHKRTSLILYASHSDFQQTNVLLDYLTEGTGGFTELFKNRAVVAFDGSYSDLWHVIRHELVHVFVNDMIYGGNIQSVISGRVRLNIPLWMNEGLAEYISMGWDTNADMILRDLATMNEIPTIDQLNYYMAYKGGQSVYRFIADKYGEPKIGEIWDKMKSRKNVERGFRASIGMDTKELTEKWHRWLRREYWSDVIDRNELGEISTKLTDHEKLRNYFNTSPAISPAGDQVAIMSDRKGYADIYLISIIDGKEIKKILSGQKKPDLEELKWLYPRLSWSPDGKKIVLAVKSGESDGLIILDVESGNTEKHNFDGIEELFTAAWSPNGQKIAFVGLQNDRTDIFLYDLSADEITQLTDDQYSDFEPAWSPDSKQLIFSSQRGLEGDSLGLAGETDLSSVVFRQKDLFIYDLESSSTRRVTSTAWNENYPVWANTRNAIFYTSDNCGISNLRLLDLDTHEDRTLTNVITGLFQPSLTLDDSRLVYAGYEDVGWDIFVISNPLEMEDLSAKIRPTNYAIELDDLLNRPAVVVEKDTTKLSLTEASYTKNVETDASYTNYIFAPGYEDYQPEPTPEDSAGMSPDSLKFKTDDGDYIINQYKTKFTLDLIDSQAGYNTFWGFQGTTVFAFSDLLGDHRFMLGTELYIDLENSDYYLAYEYLQKRTNYSVMGFHTANFFGLSFYQVLRLRNYGADFSVSRPFSKFSRVELGATSYNVEQKLINLLTGTTDYHRSINTILPRTALIYDNTLWGYFYPVDGWRMRLDFIASPKYNNNSLQFNTLEMDARRYFKLNREYSFGLRLTAGLSEGSNAQRFFLGGESNWINQQFKQYHNYEDVESIYFSEFVTPLRGARYYEREGDRFFLGNFEFRYPFIKYLAMGWPIPLTMASIQGATFLDIGSAWFGDKFQPFGKDPFRGLYMNDLVSGFGFGARFFFGYFILKVDVAWRYDFDQVSAPRYYFSLGTDF